MLLPLQRREDPFSSAHQVTSVKRTLIQHPLATALEEWIGIAIRVHSLEPPSLEEDRIGSKHQVTGVGPHKSGTVLKHKLLHWKNGSDAPPSFTLKKKHLHR